MTEKIGWFEFSQNNSGGHFIVDDDVAHSVFIEAASKAEATDRALMAGVYFDGCASGADCHCCGDRWSKLYDDEPDPVPSRYGKPLNHTEYCKYSKTNRSFFDGGFQEEARLYFRDGTKRAVRTLKEVSALFKEKGWPT
jgi:hypothetical protein